MIDQHRYRKNVGIIIANAGNQLLWARRRGRFDAWQFPQGGVDLGETPQVALYRELYEELGLKAEDIEVLAETRDWLSYEIPKAFQRRGKTPVLGQRQKWFLCRLTGDERSIRFDVSAEPEFSQWRWVDYWYPVDHIIDFKRAVYQQVLREFAPLLNMD